MVSEQALPKAPKSAERIEGAMIAGGAIVCLCQMSIVSTRIELSLLSTLIWSDDKTPTAAPLTSPPAHWRPLLPSPEPLLSSNRSTVRPVEVCFSKEHKVHETHAIAVGLTIERYLKSYLDDICGKWCHPGLLAMQACLLV